MKPTAERVRSMLYYNAVELKNPFIWQSWYGLTLNDANSYVDEGVLIVKIDGTFYPADQLAWLIMTGEWPEHEIHHADGNKLNNSWGNIKDKTPSLKAE